MAERTAVHLMGIGGIGVSALARIALSRGWRVSGCDRDDSDLVRRLRAEGAEVAIGHDAGHIARYEPHLVIYTAAIAPDHPELEAARRAGVEVVGRAEYLGRLMADHPGPRVSIAGTHGKSTTTGMVTCALTAAGLDPTCLIGAEYPAIGGNLRLGASGLFVAESCEAYGSFHALKPDIAVVTSADADHLDHYGDSEAFAASFVRFCLGIAHGGALIYCADDAAATAVSLQAARERPDLRLIPYSLDGNPDSGWVAHSEEPAEGVVRAGARRVGEADTWDLNLLLPGDFNLRNALAALAVATECGADPKAAAAALGAFAGVGRRQEYLGNRGGVDVWDDYAHHPTELAALLGGMRRWRPGRRLVVVFQPHLYSRTRDFLQAFAEALATADLVIVDRIYAAREKDTFGVHGSDLVAAIGALAPEMAALYADSDEECVAALRRVCREGDLLLTVGAGDVNGVARAFLEP